MAEVDKGKVRRALESAWSLVDPNGKWAKRIETWWKNDKIRRLIIGLITAAIAAAATYVYNPF